MKVSKIAPDGTFNLLKHFILFICVNLLCETKMVYIKILWSAVLLSILHLNLAEYSLIVQSVIEKNFIWQFWVLSVLLEIPKFVNNILKLKKYNIYFINQFILKLLELSVTILKDRNPLIVTWNYLWKSVEHHKHVATMEKTHYRHPRMQ